MKKVAYLSCFLFLLGFIVFGCAAQEAPEIQEPQAPLQENKTNYKNSNGSSEKPSQDSLESLPSCGDKTDFFSALPIDLTNLIFIRPLGFVGSAPEHIYPTDHVYVFLKRGTANTPMEFPIYSPGDVWVTRIREAKMERPVPNTTDYAIYFSPCQEFEAFYTHLSTVTDKIKSEIKPPFRWCRRDEDFGRFTMTICEKDIKIKLSAGELLGTVGQLDWQYSVDLGAYDLRTPALNYANPSRWQKWQQHIVCPLDYFSQEVGGKLKAKLGEEVLRTEEPVCGEVQQDIKNTAQGTWFVKGAGMHARPELSLIHDFIDPSIGAFAFGVATEKSGLVPNVLHFNPKSSGLVNRDFKDITFDGNIYCYENLVKQWSFDKKPESLIVLVQLTSPTTLRIEGKEATSCGNGPWSFSSDYTEFER